ncbi:MAG: hypothetical protein DWB44_09465 [Chloroflexi bacterium]|nr:hypothetical protein [Chloroflexota bacterium]MBV6438120.1 hypothetical protein [Anaerolineae bacterium]MBW7880892.1 hypothetical protein [Anaerolineae bacterium]MEB2366113.1 terminase family protein [Chloroflexota bacterium]
MTLKLPPLHPAQAAIYAHPARFKVIACGRRFGKTELGKQLLLHHATNGGVTWWISPTYGMAGQVWRDLRQVLAPLKPTVTTVERRIDLEGGGVVAVRSGMTPDFLRGAGLDYAVLDEAAFLPADLWPEVVRPMLIDRRGGAAFLSSPNGRNHFYHLYALGLDPQQPEWAAFHHPSHDNPRLDRAELEALRATLPDIVYRAEILAEFVDSAGQVFRDVDLRATAPADAVPHADQRVVIGVDWGKSVDYTVCAVIDANRGVMLALDRFNGLSWAETRRRIADLARRWNAQVVWAEANAAGDVNIEALIADGVPVCAFQTTARSKPVLIDKLALALEHGELALLPDPVLLSELNAFRVDPMPLGGYRYSAPAGLHDDTVIALALAWHGARTSTVGIGFA